MRLARQIIGILNKVKNCLGLKQDLNQLRQNYKKFTRLYKVEMLVDPKNMKEWSLGKFQRSKVKWKNSQIKFLRLENR